MSYLRQIEDLLRDSGAKLVRTKKHNVWRFPDGRIWVVAGSPRSDSSWKTNLHDLRKMLGQDLSAKSNPERKAKPGIKHPVRFEPVGQPKDTWADKFAQWLKEHPLRSLEPPPPLPCATHHFTVTRFATTPGKVILRRLLR